MVTANEDEDDLCSSRAFLCQVWSLKAFRIAAVFAPLHTLGPSADSLGVKVARIWSLIITLAPYGPFQQMALKYLILAK